MLEEGIDIDEVFLYLYLLVQAE